MVTLTIAAAGPVPLARGLPVSVTIPKQVENATIADVKAAIAAKYPKVGTELYSRSLGSCTKPCVQFYPARQKLTLKGDKKALSDEVTLQAAGISEDAELGVKDLGPQISWRTVFLVEYVSLIHYHSFRWLLKRH